MFKLLIVEDDPDMLAFYEANHKKYAEKLSIDYTFDIATCATIAQDLIRKKSVDNLFYYDIIIIDWLLPGDLSGVDLARWIRTECADGRYPCLLMSTVQKGLENVIEALAAGCDDYIMKPFTEKTFNIRMAVAKQQSTQREMLRKAEKSTKDLSKHMQSVLNSLRVGTVLLDKNTHHVLYYNELAANMTQNGIKLNAELKNTLNLTDKNRNLLRTWQERREGLFTLNLARDYWLELEGFDSYSEADHYIIYMQDVTELTRARNAKKNDLDGYLGQSFAAMRTRQQIEMVASGDWNVLIEGETGTGKEVAAKALHNLSPRRDKVFLAVNCAGLTETLAASVLFGHKKGSFTGALSDHKGYFESAEGGTLFLDEIGDISPMIQVMLLRAIELKEITRVGDTASRSVNVRLLAATNKSLADEVQRKAFRADLFYRLNTSYVKLEPLRDRREDIPIFVEHFLDEHRLQYPSLNSKVNSEAMQILMNYSWPGNIRELKSVIQFAAVQAADGMITPALLPQSLVNSNLIAVPVRRGSDEKSRIIDATKLARGNMSEVAKLLGISRATLYRKLKKHEILFDR